jgi:hypothetical protein
LYWAKQSLKSCFTSIHPNTAHPPNPAPRSTNIFSSKPGLTLKQNLCTVLETGDNQSCSHNILC